MNSLLSPLKNIPENPQCGDIYEYEGMRYLLTEPIEKQYVCINFADGNRWLDPQPNIEEAIEGLSFVGRNMKIIIQDNLVK